MLGKKSLSLAVSLFSLVSVNQAEAGFKDYLRPSVIGQAISKLLHRQSQPALIEIEMQEFQPKFEEIKPVRPFSYIRESAEKDPIPVLYQTNDFGINTAKNSLSSSFASLSGSLVIGSLRSDAGNTLKGVLMSKTPVGSLSHPMDSLTSPFRKMGGIDTYTYYDRMMTRQNSQGQFPAVPDPLVGKAFLACFADKMRGPKPRPALKPELFTPLKKQEEVIPAISQRITQLKQAHAQTTAQHQRRSSLEMLQTQQLVARLKGMYNN